MVYYWVVLTTIGCSKVGQEWIFHAWQCQAWPVTYTSLMQ